MRTRWMANAGLVALSLGAGWLYAAGPQQDPVLEDCVISLINQVPVPGGEPGILTDLEVKEGSPVQKEDLLARIDDREAQAQLKIKQAEYKIAQQKSKDEVEIQAATAQAEAEGFKYERSRMASNSVKGAVVEVELKELKFRHDYAVLKIQEARLKQQEAVLTEAAKLAELEAAQVGVKKRKILAPFDGGIVVKVYRHVGEWVPVGEPVVEVIQIDKLRIESALPASEYDPQEIEGRAVTVDAKLAHGKTERFTGKITFVDPEVQQNGKFDIWAEIDNRPDKRGTWLLRPGLDAKMTIHLGNAGPTKLSTAEADTKKTITPSPVSKAR